jgi:hypothetical protein
MLVVAFDESVTLVLGNDIRFSLHVRGGWEDLMANLSAVGAEFTCQFRGEMNNNYYQLWGQELQLQLFSSATTLLALPS